jgi:WD40 repeat protein
MLAPAERPDELGRLGAYRVLKVLSMGGMGMVFEAEDVGLGRRVALKLLKPALAASPSARKRFRREARAAAAIQHDHIVTIYQEGEECGIPFLAMQLLAGESLDSRLRREGRLPVAEVVHIGREIAEGLAAAHGQGLIHRDIKPANVWLEAETGRVKILDFGLARAVQEGSHLTQPGVIAGTPQYMAPEQASGQLVDTRADLFSLGCVLYRMATGKPPFPGEDTLAVLRSLELKQPLPPRKVNPEVPAALADLILHLLAKKPGARPASAAAVAAALASIEARPGAAGRQREVRRRKWLALAGAGGGLVTMILVSSWLGPGPGDAKLPTDKRPSVQKPGNRCPADDLRWDQIPAYELAIAGGGNPRKAPAELVAILGDSRLIPGGGVGLALLQFSPDGKSLATLDYAGGIILWDAGTGRQRWAFRIDSPPRQRGWHWAAFGPDSRMLAVAQRLGLTLLDTANGRPVGKVAEGLAVSSVAFSPDGKWLAWANAAGPITVWDRHADRARRTLPAKPLSSYLSFGPDSRTLVVGNWNDHTINEWDTGTGNLRHLVKVETEDPGAYALAVSPDARTLSVAYENAGTVKLWDAATGKVRQVLGRLSCIKARTVAFSPNGRLLAAGGWQGDLRLWDVKTGRQVHQLWGHWTSILTLAFSPDGRTLASGDDHGVLKLWDVKTGRLWVPAAGHRGPVNTLAVRPDGRGLASGDSDGTVKYWDFSTRREQPSPVGHKGRVLGLAFSPDGRTLASAGWDARVRLWDPATGSLKGTLQASDFWIYRIAWHRQQNLLASTHADGTVRLWDPVAKALRKTFRGHKAPVNWVAFGPDGQLMASGDEGGVVLLWETATGRIRHELQGEAVAFRPDGKVLATTAQDKIHLWSVPGCEKIRTYRLPGSVTQTVAFSPDGRTLAAGNHNGTVFLWDAAGAGRPPRKIRLAPGAGIGQVAFTPEGRHLVIAHGNGTICVLRLSGQVSVPGFIRATKSWLPPASRVK